MLWQPHMPHPSPRRIAAAAVLCALLAGCNQGPFQGTTATVPGATVPGATVPGTTVPGSPVYPAQVQDLNLRASALDADNRDLHTELARSQQQVKVLEDEVVLLREQLQEKATDLRDMLAAKENSDQRVQSLEAASRYRGGATITANNSMLASLQAVDIPGLEVRRDEDVVRIELPADRLFRQNSNQLLPSARPWLDRVAAAISQSYARQMVGIEGHTDNTSLGTLSNHQLSASQAVAVFAHFTQQNRLSDRQLFTVGYGSNQPLASNATPAGRARNRRVEVVIYPEAAD